MRITILIIVLVVALALGVDRYIARVIRQRTHIPWLPRLHRIVSIVGWVVLALTYTFVAFIRVGDSVFATAMWMLYCYFSIYIPKYIFVLFDLLARIPQLWHGRRLKPLTVAGLAAALLTFGIMWWSALYTRTHIEVKEVTAYIPDLPASLDGYRIVQFSDAHTGTWNADTTFTTRIVDTVNALDADLVVFTGDIVNRHTSELVPQVPVFSRLRARDGVASILGNHDYGDYYAFRTPEERLDNNRLLHSLERQMGWTLLRDSTLYVTRGSDTLAIVGVENIGDPPFHIYGSLPRAYATLGDTLPKVLLTHNPMHWADSVAPNPDINIALTLSGHTHGMQMQFFGLSPAVLRYPYWGGMYTDDTGKQLYVNRGIGTVGFPVRIGSSYPELTLITLRPSSHTR